MTGGGSEDLERRLDALCEEGFEIWDRFDREVREARFHPFIASDYAAVREALRRHAAPGRRFLELGSATGVITSMAALMGYEACGIELDESLVRVARELAERHDAPARFVAGSFVPGGYTYPAGVHGNIGEGTSAYPALGLALDDFDVVFGFPWDHEDGAMRALWSRYGNPEGVFLWYDVAQGVREERRARRG